MKKIIINGANGYIASNFIHQLLQLNYKVIALVRGSQKESARERMEKALSECTNQETIIKSTLLEVHHYELLENNFAMNTASLNSIFEGATEYFHFAANLKFSKRMKDEIFKTNIEGLSNSLDVFMTQASNQAKLYFVSTAYSCGINNGNFEERFYDNADIIHFRNYYEQSKRLAENIIKKHVKERGLKAYILRPSQVVGHQSTGITKTDFGVFDFIKRLAYLAKRYPNETIRIKAEPNITQNLIPIDTLVDHLIKILELENAPSIINLVGRKAMPNKKIIECVNEVLPINILFKPNLNKEEMSPLEKIIDAGMAFTGSYMTSPILFHTENLSTVNSDTSMEITQNSFKSMMNYFIQHN